MSAKEQARAKFETLPVQVRIKGIHVAKLFDSKFVGLLGKEFPNIRYGVVHLYLPRGVDEEKLEAIMLGHFAMEHDKESLFTVDADEPETLKKLVEVLGRFLEGEHG